MNIATLVFSALGFAGLGIVGIAVKAIYLNVEKVPANAAVRVMSSIFAVFVLLIGMTLAGLALSFVLTKEWPMLTHFLLLASLCAVSIYFQVNRARKTVKAAAEVAPASARVEPTVDAVSVATPAVAPASAEQPASAASVASASAVAATTPAVASAVAATEIHESELPDAPAPAVISAVADADLDAWTPDDEEEVAAPVAQSTQAEPAAESKAVDSKPVPELDPQSVLEMDASADIEEITAAVQPAIPAAATSSVTDDAADVLDLKGVTKVSDATETVNAEHRVDAVAPASNNETTRPIVAPTSDISVAVA